MRCLAAVAALSFWHVLVQTTLRQLFRLINQRSSVIELPCRRRSVIKQWEMEDKNCERSSTYCMFILKSHDSFRKKKRKGNPRPQVKSTHWTHSNALRVTAMLVAVSRDKGWLPIRAARGTVARAGTREGCVPLCEATHLWTALAKMYTGHTRCSISRLTQYPARRRMTVIPTGQKSRLLNWDRDWFGAQSTERPSDGYRGEAIASKLSSVRYW